MESLGIYISVPFCRAKCTYCNFASGVSSAAAHQDYVEQVCAEIRTIRHRFRSAVIPERVDSIYLGGGTPSLLDPRLIAQLARALHEEFAIAPEAEITLECAPGQLNDPSLEGMLALGVNRISFGVQSLVDEEASATGRFHTRATVLEDLERVHAAGIQEVSIDLIAGMPHQTAASWQESLDVLAATGVPHASIYMLEIDDDSRLGRELLSGGSRYHARAIPSEDLVADFYETAILFLKARGLVQYEISNFASGQHESRHNLKYWRRHPYLGFGLDAHSMIRDRGGCAVRYNNPDVLPLYLSAPLVSEGRRLKQAEELEEAWFLGLRLRAGVAWSALVAEFGQESLEPSRPEVAGLIENGLLIEEAGMIRLTQRGVLFSNEVFSRFLGAGDSLLADPEPADHEPVIQLL